MNELFISKMNCLSLKSSLNIIQQGLLSIKSNKVWMSKNYGLHNNLTIIVVNILVLCSSVCVYVFRYKYQVGANLAKNNT